MRGKEQQLTNAADQVRITPACAGKSGRFDRLSGCPRDHPRMCGEKEAFSPAEIRYWGSPPRMRGKAFLTECRSAGVGITPAHAGKRKRNKWHTCNRWDHPRTCGEKMDGVKKGNLALGSPPHMRGKVMNGIHDKSVPRITPAHAGKRSGPLPAAVPAGPAGSCPASRPSQFPPRMTVIRPRP